MSASRHPRHHPRTGGRLHGRFAVLVPVFLALTVVAVAVPSMVRAPVAGASPSAPAQEVTDPSEPDVPEVSEVPDVVATPQLRIEIDNGRTSTTSGDTLEYTVTVVNLGTDDLTALGISQTLPQGMTFGSADAGGTAEADAVRWTADLAADETITFHTTMMVTDTPEDLLRLATVACATEADADGPLVCATHSDELPAGVAAAAAAPAAAGEGDGGSDGADGSLPWPAIAGAIAAVAVLVAAGVVLARRRHASLPPRRRTPDITPSRP